ncbi:MAG: STAS domain-containing protein [Chloroflexi bacterium]|nr:STAS domain-containing protein [Chloroflexota bacterium]
MEISVTQEQGRVPVTVLQLKGDLNAATCDALQTKAKEVIDAGSRNVVVDLSGVGYMSSAGMRTLNQMFTWLTSSAAEGEAIRKGIASGKAKSPHLKLVNPTQRVLEALKLAGFDMFLEIHPNAKQAIASF